MKQLNALIAPFYPLNAAQLISHSCLWLCTFVWLFTLSYLEVPPKHLFYFYPHSVTAKHILWQSGEDDIRWETNKLKKMVKWGSKCFVIKWVFRDNRDSFFTLLLPKKLLINPKQGKKIPAKDL